MKKTILISAALLLQALCFAAGVKVIKDCKIYDGNYYLKGTLKKDTIVKLWDCSMRDQRNNDELDFDYSICLNIDGQKRLADASAVIPAETEEFFSDEILNITRKRQGKYLTYIEDCDVLFSKTRQTYYNLHKESIDYFESRRGIYDGPWYEAETINPSGIHEISLILRTDSRAMLFVKKIETIKNGYKVLTEVFKTDTDQYDNSKELFERLFVPNAEVTIIIIQDGDYIHFYTEENELIVSCAVVDEEFVVQYENLIRTNKCDLSKVNWPRHADGTCDYDNANDNATASASGNPDTSAEAAVSKPAPAMGKTVTVTENLRLRIDEQTTSDVVATLAAGTRVKVLALGRKDTIDGIASNWVQVSVLGGAKDKDGNALEAETIGWLFGGYLFEAESAVESENADAKESSSLPIMPIVVVGAALAVLLAAILLATKKRKTIKD